ncbi:hypothetical protein [Aurantibacillus circumpalustris]|uniref:hypothetical protein n=1 Tax=Aurantibacillus circumpalustris TaxID=3036359 RepID=UPI00295ADAE8|nr:hypothetical protein [Aurantibacillus circumpalustris]
MKTNNHDKFQIRPLLRAIKKTIVQTFIFFAVFISGILMIDSIYQNLKQFSEPQKNYTTINCLFDLVQ